MAIEDLETTNSNQQIVVRNTDMAFDSAFKASNYWYSGLIKVRHPLIDEPMIVYGFIGKCKYLNFDLFKIHGMKITFPNKEGNYHIYNEEKIFPKVLANLKQNWFSELFPDMYSIELTCEIMRNRSVYNILVQGGSLKGTNYYFFESNSHPEPSAASDEIYLVCKYKKEGQTQYDIFAPHEVMLDNQ